MILQRYSLHKIEANKDFTFKTSEYSRFKYGSKLIARKFGEELAKGFIKSHIFQDYLENYGDKTIVVLASPYCFVPTATFAMKDYFLSELNTILFTHDKPPAQECKIFREYSYNSDYGNMSSEERKKNISSDTFHVDESFLKNKYCIFLDDIRITGSHEERIDELCERLDVKKNSAKCIYMYFAELISGDPKIENFLNLCGMYGLQTIHDIFQKDGLLFNTRCIKYILGASEEEFKYFIRYHDEKFARTLYRLAIGNSYNKLPEFKNNFIHLKNKFS